MKKIIAERLAGGEKARRNDILQILIDTQQANDPEERLSDGSIAQETVLVLIAGSETTSNTTGFAFIELMKNPEMFAKLRQEIDAVEFEDGQKLFTHEQLKNLPYLNAVINETLRLDAISAGGLERMPDQDIVLDGRLFVPKGVSNIFAVCVIKIFICIIIIFYRLFCTVTCIMLTLTLIIGLNPKNGSLKDGCLTPIIPKRQTRKPSSHSVLGKFFFFH